LQTLPVSDKLPESGPALYVVIIVGVVAACLVAVALWLLVKYLMYRSQRWQEILAERNMERAIQLYNDQQEPPESDYMYTALPAPQVDQHSPSHHHHRSGYRHHKKGR
jgi:hypothetical protein